jgi:thioredoxin 1
MRTGTAAAVSVRRRGARLRSTISMAQGVQDLTDQTFDPFVKGNKVVLVDYWAPWCGPCRRVSPIVEELAKENAGKVAFAKLNTDENPMTAGKFGIMSIPTLQVWKDGKVVDQMVGAYPKQNISEMLKRHA